MKQTWREFALLMGIIGVIIVADQLCLHLTGNYLSDYIIP